MVVLILGSEPEVYHEWNELDKDAESTNEATKRLAVCNMDWDKVKAIDLMALFKSFLPPHGEIYSVTVSRFLTSRSTFFFHFSHD